MYMASAMVKHQTLRPHDGWHAGPLPVGGKSPIGILNKVGPFQEILKIVTNLFIFDRSCQKTITLLVSYKR